MLNIRIGSWPQNEHLKNRKTDAQAEHARKEFMCMVRVLIKVAEIALVCKTNYG